MCIPHVINLCAQAAISQATSLEIGEVEEDENKQYTNPKILDAIRPDPIALARLTVVKIRASGQRRDALDNLITTGNSQKWWTHDRQPLVIKKLQLLRDVKHRWDSVYKMLERFRTLQQARILSFNIKTTNSIFP